MGNYRVSVCGRVLMAAEPFLQSLFHPMSQHGSADSGLYEPEAQAAPHSGRTAPRQGHIRQPFDRVWEATDQILPACTREHIRSKSARMLFHRNLADFSEPLAENSVCVRLRDPFLLLVWQVSSSADAVGY